MGKFVILLKLLQRSFGAAKPMSLREYCSKTGLYLGAVSNDDLRVNSE